MKYHQVQEAVFLERPNRFVAYVERLGQKETVHVKNTGRCRELLQEGCRVYLEESDQPGRSTRFDLIAVQKNDRLINIDSQAPNKAVGEWLQKKELFPELTFLKPECVYGNSRFDFYYETKDAKGFLEVKGVTLEENGVVSFPDAPSERAVKHLKELIEAKQAGFEANVLFVIQMEGADYFTPNAVMQPEFAEALREAQRAGVRVLAYDCRVRGDSMTIKSPVPVFTGNGQELTEALLTWYDGNRRILPWREQPEPYRVWVSEIMLQQTRVEAVKPYFERFMQTCPDIRSLAEAEEEVLLKLWEGLGYYNRVRNMQKAAIQIMEEYGGNMPADYEALKKLSGIGSYTAGAIASIAFGQPVPAVDGNVLRVLSRLVMDQGDITNASVKKRMEEQVQTMIPEERAGDFTQAMIEIGALVCVPNGSPHCGECPFSSRCQAHRKDCETAFPVKAEKKKRRQEEKTVLLVMDGEKVALHKRPSRGLLAGLYEFPMLDGYCTDQEVLDFCRTKGLSPLRIQPLPEAKHIFSHVEWRMKGYAVRVDELASEAKGRQTDSWLFAEPAEAGERYPIPSAFSAYTRHLNILQGNDKFIKK